MNPARPDWARVRHVLLDMDGTLLDLAFDNYFWRELVPERYAAARGLSLEAARAQLTPRFQAIQHTLPWYCTDYWSRETGLSMAQLKHEIRDRIRLFEGSREFLETLRDSGREVWLVTNAHHDSWQLKLSQTGITDCFHRIISSHDFGAPKEDAVFWQRLMAAHPFEREHALFADDSLPVLQAARAFGIGQVIAMTHPDTGQAPRVIEGFASVARLPQLLPL
jgi:putative hydrolase of the HAD superfamily